MKTYFKKQNPKLIIYRKYINFDLNSEIYYQMTRVWKLFKILVSKSWIFLLHWRQNMFVQIKRLPWKNSCKKLSWLDQNKEIIFLKDKTISNRNAYFKQRNIRINILRKTRNSIIQTLRLVKQLTIKSFGKPWRISFPISQTISNNYSSRKWYGNFWQSENRRYFYWILRYWL